MLISFDWLRQFLTQDLPSAKDFVRGITLRAFEVESIQEKNGDIVVDIDVLPNRAYDCLSHRGIAREVSAVFSIPFKDLQEPQTLLDDSIPPVQIQVSTDLCKRYIGVRAEGITITDSPEWLRSGLERLDQRSINSVVDATNYILHMYGQPMHVFDADKVKGELQVRMAKCGETITTLDGQEIELDASVMVITDEEGVLAIAGIKGGKKAEVTKDTKNIIIESALFDGPSVRKASRKVGIRTDASKRFENGIAAKMALVGVERLIDLVSDLHPGIRFSQMTDIFPFPPQPVVVKTPRALILERLGIDLADDQIVSLLESINIQTTIEDTHIISHIPEERLDLTIPEDILEEIGRLYGYEKISTSLPPHEKLDDDASTFVLAQSVRSALLPLGFSEIYTPSFSEKGDVRVTNPINQDAPHLRVNLSEHMVDKLSHNLKHILFDTDAVMAFEVGTVFPGDTEEMRVAFGLGHTKPKYHKDTKILKEACEALGVSFGDCQIAESDTITVLEIALQKISAKKISLDPFLQCDVTYKPYSQFPRVVRDISLFVPEGTEVNEVVNVIASQVTDLCVTGPILFDKFSKEGHTSLTFRLVFQSFEKTLSDEEVNAIMDKVYSEIKENTGWNVR